MKCCLSSLIVSQEFTAKKAHLKLCLSVHGTFPVLPCNLKWQMLGYCTSISSQMMISSKQTWVYSIQHLYVRPSSVVSHNLELERATQHELLDNKMTYCHGHKKSYPYKLMLEFKCGYNNTERIKNHKIILLFAILVQMHTIS